MNDWRLRLAQTVIAIGALGFLVCWSIGWNTERRVFSDTAYASKGPDRLDAVEVKGKVYYLQPTFAKQFNVSQRAIFYFFGVAVIGAAYVEKRKRRDKK